MPMKSLPFLPNLRCKQQTPVAKALRPLGQVVLQRTH